MGKDVEQWEQRKLDAENALEKTDRLRWAFRQIGEEKNSPILIDELEDFFEKMGWSQLTKKEISAVKKVARDPELGGDSLDLQALRKYTNEIMPVRLLEGRLKADVVEEINPEEIYSPRTWRGKLDAKKDGKGGKSPRSKSPKSPRGDKSPRDREDGGARSPRGGKD